MVSKAKIEGPPWPPWPCSDIMVTILLLMSFQIWQRSIDTFNFSAFMASPKITIHLQMSTDCSFIHRLLNDYKFDWIIINWFFYALNPYVFPWHNIVEHNSLSSIEFPSSISRPSYMSLRSASSFAQIFEPRWWYCACFDFLFVTP